MSGSLEKRFHRKVSAKTPSGCIEWMAATNGKYGIIRSSDKPFPWLLAHRVAYELHYGPVPDGMHVLHKCDNPKCVNWEHLFAGTRQENSRDMVSKGRQRRSVLSQSDVAAIREMREKGMTQKEIALNFGVSRPLISLLLSGKISRLQPY